MPTCVVAIAQNNDPDLARIHALAVGVNKASGNLANGYSCGQIKNGLGNVGHAGSVLTIAGWGYTAWTGVTIPYLTGATVVFAGADLIFWGMGAIPGCN